MKRYEKIVCPRCKAEYLPVEIYYPNYFFKKPSKLFKDDEGKIRTVIDGNMDLKEKFRCYYCNRDFYVTAVLSFKTSDKPDQSDNFEEEYLDPTKKIALAE